jgi:hypothetical protein
LEKCPPLAEPGQYATISTARLMLNRSRDTRLLWALRIVVQTSDTRGSAYRKMSNFGMSTRHCGHVLAYCTCPGWLWGWRSWWNEMWLAGETEVLGVNLPRRHFVHHEFQLPDPGANPSCRGGKPATNLFSYGAAFRRGKMLITWDRLKKAQFWYFAEGIVKAHE